MVFVISPVAIRFTVDCETGLPNALLRLAIAYSERPQAFNLSMI